MGGPAKDAGTPSETSVRALVLSLGLLLLLTGLGGALLFRDLHPEPARAAARADAGRD